MAVAKRPYRSTTSAPSLGRSDGIKTKQSLHSPPGCVLSTATAAAIGRNFRPEGRSGGGGGGTNTQSDQDTSLVGSSNRGLHLTLVPFEGYSTPSATCADRERGAARSASTSCAAFSPMSKDGGVSPDASSARDALSLIQSLLCDDVASEKVPGHGRRINERAVEHPLLKALHYQLQPSSGSAAALHAIAVALQHLARCGGEVLETVCRGLEVRALAEVGCDGIATNHAALSGGSRETLCLLIHMAPFFAWGEGSVDLSMLTWWNLGYVVAHLQDLGLACFLAFKHGEQNCAHLHCITVSQDPITLDFRFTTSHDSSFSLTKPTSQQVRVCVFES